MNSHKQDMTRRFLYVARLILNYITTLYGLIHYLLFRSSNQVVYQSMVGLHASSNGKSTLILNRIINLIELIRYKSFTINQNQDINLIFDNPISQNDLIVNSLFSEGYSIDPNNLKKILIDKIIENEKLFSGKLLLLDDSYIENQSLLEARQKQNPVRLDYYSDSLLKNSPEIQRIAKSSYFLKIAESFLGVPPYLDSVTAWRTFPLRGHLHESSKGAQLFHYDLDRLSWLKIFIYLTDVGDGCGAHLYIKGSHLITKNRREILKRGYVRVSDSDLEIIYGKDKIKKIFGTAGTIIYGNTQAFHKGEPPRDAERFILELQYTANNYGTQPIKIEDRAILKEIFDSNPTSNHNHPFRLL